MKLKRIFKNGEISAIRILHLSPRWHISPRIMEKGVAEGWMSVSKGKLTLHTEDGQDDVVYDIVAPPDRKAAKNYYHCEVVTNG